MIADVFNVTNHVNFANPPGNQGAPANFLLLNAYSTSYAPRKLQLGVRYQSVACEVWLRTLEQTTVPS